MHAPCRRGSPPKRAVPVALGPTQDQTSAAISIRRVARLSRNVGQPDHILTNPVMSHKAERRPGSGEIWFAVTKHDGVQVDSILINQAKFGEALRQGWASNFDLPVALGLQLADRALKIIPNKPGVGADRLQRARDDPFRLVPPCCREGAFFFIPFRMIVVPITHDLVHFATVHTACQPLRLLDEVAEERGAWRKRHMIDVAVQGLVHSEDELSHTHFLSLHGTSAAILIALCNWLQARSTGLYRNWFWSAHERPTLGLPDQSDSRGGRGSLEPDRHPRPDVRQPPSLPRVADPVGRAPVLQTGRGTTRMSPKLERVPTERLEVPVEAWPRQALDLLRLPLPPRRQTSDLCRSRTGVVPD